MDRQVAPPAGLVEPMMADPWKVILEDNLREALIRQLRREGFAKGQRGEPPRTAYRSTSSAALADSLAALVVFDEVIIPTWGGDVESDAELSFPVLEDSGILARLPPEPPTDVWKALPRDSELVGLLTLALQYKPFILNRFMADRPSEQDRLLARAAGLSRRKMLDHLLDLLPGLMLLVGTADDGADDALFRMPLIKRMRDGGTLSVFLSYLAQLSVDVDGGVPPGQYSYFRVTALAAAWWAKHVDYLLQSSERLAASVASSVYVRGRSGWRSIRDVGAENPDHLRAFNLLRATLDEEGFPFPAVRTVHDALDLRKDPRLRDYRRVIADFHAALLSGEQAALQKLRRDIQKVRGRLEKSMRIEQALKWATYVALPVSVLEAIAFGVPAASTGLAVADVVGTMSADRLKKKARWALVGR